MREDKRETGTLIESDSFPFEFLSDLAEVESWRKEIYRPVYHVHKWWATRLGSVFRGILLACNVSDGTDFEKKYYQNHDFAGQVVFDPFMGSGTTVGEAHKLGFTAVGRDINPVAVETARVGMGKLDRAAILDAYRRLSESVGEELKGLYKATDASGLECDALYYFWVKTAKCPACQGEVDLFSSRIIARHAYAARNPIVQVVCPACGAIFPSTHRATHEICPSCSAEFDPRQGPAHNTHAHCPTCHSEFVIAEAVRGSGRPPNHRLYAKLLLRPNGDKVYLPATEQDRQAYADASRKLEKAGLALPDLMIADGYNTRQVLNYGYRSWRDFFNDRQLLALGLLHRALCDIADENVRSALFSVFSSALEFNNLFASYKGEGTGAVRHMFSHHILKPERTPIEANVWGTEKSSGAFSTLLKSRLLRCIGYRERPFEVSPSLDRTNASGAKVFGCSDPFRGEIQPGWPDPGDPGDRHIFLSCGSSHATGLATGSVDFVVTDPPFFDNVHYSELADFFYAWQQLRPAGNHTGLRTTRQIDEVQDKDSRAFAMKLEAVFHECYRVLKETGLLVFTYHHSRHDGWVSLCEACVSAGFHFVNAHPVKGEMSVAAPKSQAREPIDIDIVLACRKASVDRRDAQEDEAAWSHGIEKTRAKALRYLQRARCFSKNDMRVLLTSQLLVQLCPGRSADQVKNTLLLLLPQVEATIPLLLLDIQEHRTTIRHVRRADVHDELPLFR
jgi:putative DNA methylase